MCHLLIYASFALEKDSFAAMNLFLAANLRLHLCLLGLCYGEAFPLQWRTASSRQSYSFCDEVDDVVFLDLSFVVAKHSFVVANRGEQIAADQQLPLHLISSITLLYFPSNSAKHKQMED